MIGKILLEDGNFYLEFTKVVKKCFGCKPQEELVKMRLHPDDDKVIESNPLNILEILSGTKNKVEFELVYGDGGINYPKIHWEYIEDDDNEHIVEANGMIDDDSIEVIANQRFKSVGDDGLFPNHSDKDVWVSGFIEGFKEMQKLMEEYIVEAYNEGQKQQALSSFYTKGHIYYNNKFKNKKL